MGAATNSLHQVLIVVLAYSDAPQVAFLWNIEGGLMYVPLPNHQTSMGGICYLI